MSFPINAIFSEIFYLCFFVNPIKNIPRNEHLTVYHFLFFCFLHLCYSFVFFTEQDIFLSVDLSPSSIPLTALAVTQKQFRVICLCFLPSLECSRLVSLQIQSSLKVARYSLTVSSSILSICSFLFVPRFPVSRSLF